MVRSSHTWAASTYVQPRRNGRHEIVAIRLVGFHSYGSTAVFRRSRTKGEDPGEVDDDEEPARADASHKPADTFLSDPDFHSMRAKCETGLATEILSKPANVSEPAITSCFSITDRAGVIRGSL